MSQAHAISDEAQVSRHEARGVVVLSRLLTFGDHKTRRGMAEAVARGDRDLVKLLSSTARSGESLQLRARCVEVLGLALVDAGPEVSQQILDALLGEPNVRLAQG